MVDFTVNYKWAGSSDYEGEACFGLLKNQDEKKEWDLDSEEEISSVEYRPPEPVSPKLYQWIKDNPIFGPLIIWNSSERDAFEVDADCPADRVLATLSMLRLLAGEEREGYLNLIDELYDLTGDLSLAIYLSDMAEGAALSDNMFKYREESIVPDWNIKDFADFIKRGYVPKGKEIGIEPNYSTAMRYDSVKTAITGKAIGEYTEKNVTRLQVLDLLEYEGYVKLKRRENVRL